MNKQRRKAIQDLIDAIQPHRDALEQLKDEEQETFDNMPEGLQQGDQGQATEAAASALDDAVSNLDSAISSMGEASGRMTPMRVATAPSVANINDPDGSLRRAGAYNPAAVEIVVAAALTHSTVPSPCETGGRVMKEQEARQWAELVQLLRA